MVFKKILKQYKRIISMPDRIYRLQEAIGRIESRQLSSNYDLKNAEFRVFSQWGEDGVIQNLIRLVAIDRPIFIEFGVENYTESNTRFLLTNNQWSGLVIDGNINNISYIKSDAIYWASNLKAVHSFITKDNINELLVSNGAIGDIGLLSIDIDGNDYWIWEAINVITPRIIICEYNSHFGPTALVSTPYDKNFVRDVAHSSKIYYGASISALNALANKRGYSLVASNSAGNNLFFVRNDLLGGMETLTPEDAYRQSQFREFHDENGALTFDEFDVRLSNIGHLPVYDFQAHLLRPISEVSEIHAHLRNIG
jgi:hypothetical protein